MIDGAMMQVERVYAAVFSMALTHDFRFTLMAGMMMMSFVIISTLVKEVLMRTPPLLMSPPRRRHACVYGFIPGFHRDAAQLRDDDVSPRLRRFVCRAGGAAHKATPAMVERYGRRR